MKISKKFLTEIIFVFIIIISSLAIRFYKIEALPNGFEGDAFAWGITSLFAMHDISPSEKGLYALNATMAKSYPVSIKINQLGFTLFGKDLYSSRKILTLFSVFAVVSFYFLSRSFFNPIISFCITLLYSLSTYKLIITRIALEPAYADLFLYFFILMILLISTKNKKSNIFLSLAATLGIVLGTFSYALSFIFPVLGMLLLIIQLLKTDLKIREKILLLVIFFIPFIIIFSKWINNILLEPQLKDYASANVAFDMKTFKPDILKLEANLLTINGQLFQELTYETSDMVVSYNDTIILLPIVYLALGGFYLSLLNIKKYYPLQIWFALFFLPMVLLGLYVPRFWVNGIGVFFIFAGIPFKFLYSIIRPKFTSVVNSVLYLLILFLIFFGVFEFYNNAVKNQSFIPSLGELAIINREFKNNISDNVAFISSKQFNKVAIHPVTTFYYLAQNPDKAKEMKFMTQQDMLIFNRKEFMNLTFEEVARFRNIVVDNDYNKEIKDYLKLSLKQAFKMKKLDYFTIYEL